MHECMGAVHSSIYAFLHSCIRAFRCAFLSAFGFELRREAADPIALASHKPHKEPALARPLLIIQHRLGDIGHAIVAERRQQLAGDRAAGWLIQPAGHLHIARNADQRRILRLAQLLAQPIVAQVVVPAVVWVANGLSTGVTHTVTVTVLAASNTASSGSRVDHDAMVYLR